MFQSLLPCLFPRPRVLAAAALATLALTTTIRANVVSADYLLTTNSTKFDRPNGGTPPTTVAGGGVNWYETSQAFTVSASTSFTLSTTAANLNDGYFTDDTFLVLYQNTFNPATPLTNALSANDDDGQGPTGELSSLTFTASPGVVYYAVFTTFDPNITGSITGSFDAGNATVTLVPEPSTWALLGVGAVGAGVVALRRRQALRD